MPMRELTAKQEAFVRAIAIEGLTQTEAYRRNYNCKGWTNESIGQEGYKLSKAPHVAHKLEEMRRNHRAVTADRVTMDVMRLMETYIAIAFTDPNELISVKVGCCRYCYGDGHLFQWREGEFVEDVQKAEATENPLPDIAGGFGFSRVRPPHPECPRCDGEGVYRTVPMDTTKLSAGALHLYRGVQQTKEGVKILFADKDKALENIGRILGAFDDKLRLDLQARVKTLTLTTTDPADAARAYALMVQGG